MSKGLSSRRIIELVEDNYGHAYTLHFCGIAFYEYPDDSLEKVCQQKSLNIHQVIRQLEHSVQNRKFPKLLGGEMAVEVIIAYLQHTHHLFIRYHLPYMASLIQNINPDYFDNKELAHDLKFVFPLFAEDFIKHIKKEEEHLFAYIRRLDRYAKGRFHLTKAYRDLEKNAIATFSLHHQEDDDEMKGIRQLTDNYSFNSKTSTYTKVIFSELQLFEEHLRIHSKVENQVLFPTALRLEEKVRKLIERRAKLN